MCHPKSRLWEQAELLPIPAKTRAEINVDFLIIGSFSPDRPEPQTPQGNLYISSDSPPPPPLLLLTSEVLVCSVSKCASLLKR